MREDVSIRATERQTVKRGLTVGCRDGRRNELRESDRRLQARRVRRGVLTTASAEDCAAFQRIWSAVKKQVHERGLRPDRVAAAREAMESGALDTLEALEACAKALLRGDD